MNNLQANNWVFENDVFVLRTTLIRLKVHPPFSSNNKNVDKFTYEVYLHGGLAPPAILLERGTESTLESAQISAINIIKQFSKDLAEEFEQKHEQHQP